MPATRVLPTDEATDLIHLVRDLADQGAAPARRRGRGQRDLPARGLPTARPGRPARAALRRGVRRRRPALRGLPAGRSRRSPRVWASVGVGVCVHALSCFGLVTRGTEEQQQRGCPTCSAATCSAPTASPRRTPAPTRRRCARPARRDGDDYVHQRREGVGHPRRPGRLLQGDGAHLRRAQRHLLLPGPGRHRGLQRRPARAEDGPDRLHHRDHAASTTSASRPTGCSATRATASRSRSPASTPAGSASRRSPPASPRPRSTTRSPTPRSARRSASRSSTTRAWPSCWPTWPPRSSRPGRRTLRAARLQGPRPAVLPRGLDRQAGRHRQRDEGDHRRRPGPRRLRLHPRLPGRALHARGQGHADLRGHQPDPADGDRPRARPAPRARRSPPPPTRKEN